MSSSSGFDPALMLVHDGFIRAIARGLLAEPSAVDDVVQQTWLRALRTPPAASGSLRGWLAAVTRNNALTALRRTRRRERHERAAAVVPHVPSAARIVEQEAVRREVVEAVLKLEEHYRSVVLLRFYENLPPRVVAERLGLPVETVRTRLKRALALLRGELDAHHGGDRKAWALVLAPFTAESAAAASIPAMVAGLVLGHAKAAAALLILATIATTWWVMRAPASPAQVPGLSQSAQLAPAPITPDDGLQRAAIAAGGEQATDARVDQKLISRALEDYALEQIRRGWSDLRKDPIPADQIDEGWQSFEAIVMESPYKLGRDLAERRTNAEKALEDARTGGVFALLHELDAGGVGPLDELVARGPFDAFFQRTSGSAVTIDGPSHAAAPDAALEDGATLLFPAGAYQVTNLMAGKNPFPRDVTVAGAGMDATLLVMGDLDTREELRNFILRDCTVFTDSKYLFTLYGAPGLVTAERVRFIGFDSGLGASCLFAAIKGLALRASDCRFEGGYGKGTDGTIFDVRTDALLARFDRCSFRAIVLCQHWLRPGATVVMRHCTLTDILDDPKRRYEGRGKIFFDACEISRYEGPRPYPRRDLNELFPNWRELLAR